MSKARGRNDERSRIAHMAARLMVQDGIEDYAVAKRKAARQAGLTDARQLPTNEEIDVALRTYQTLYCADAQRERLQALRSHALEVMRDLARFNPYLTGSVLTGSAGKYADINIQLYTDDAKGVEMFLLDRDVPYRTGQCRMYCGTEARVVPLFLIDDEGTEIQLAVLALDDLRVPVRTTPDGKAVERARAPAVAALLAVG
jgi:hypothetical protein